MPGLESNYNFLCCKEFWSKNAIDVIAFTVCSTLHKTCLLFRFPLFLEKVIQMTAFYKFHVQGFEIRAIRLKAKKVYFLYNRLISLLNVFICSWDYLFKLAERGHEYFETTFSIT
jgi:hypothetical protein